MWKYKKIQAKAIIKQAQNACGLVSIFSYQSI